MLPLRSWGRLRQVVAVSTRYGLGYLTDRLTAEPAFRMLFARRRKPVPPEHIAAQRLADVLEALGPTYIKLGQFLSMRPDILPPVYVAALSRLYERVRPLDFREIKDLVSEEFQKPLDLIYRDFAPAARATASLAQVHTATLLDGSPVAVKVQRPGIRKVVRADLEILRELAGLVNRRIPEARVFKPEELVSEFGYQLNRELDFQLEAMRLERFRERFRDDPDVHLPRVYWDYSTERVLTMERVEGVAVQAEELERAGFLPAEIAARIFRVFLKEVLDFGMFHADPHPGNISVCDGRICLMDFGQVGILPEADREILLEIISGLVQEDLDILMAAFYRFRLVSPEINERLLRREIADFFERYRGLPARKVKLGQFIIDSIKICRRFEISFPTDMALLGKALLMVESMAASLDPDFEPLQAARPLVAELKKARLQPGYLAGRFKRKARLAGQGLAELPGLLFSIARKAESGHFKIHFLHEGLEGTTRDLEGSLNRLAWSLLISAVIISLTLLLIHLLG